MSDYLDRLVNRLFEPAAEILPRLPGLFEPGPEGTWAAGLGEELDREETFPGAPAGTSGEMLSNSPEMPDKPGLKGFSTSQALVGNPSRNETQQATAPRQPVRNMPDGEPPAQPVELPAEARPVHTQVFPVHPVPPAPPQEKSQLSYLEAQVRRIPVRTAFHEDEAGQPGPAQVYHITGEEVTQSDGSSTQKAVSAVGKPVRPETRVNPPDMSPLKPDQAEPAATHHIQVTIGRIEVRAAPPAAPAAPRPGPARHGPTVSLQDYLKRRSGGRS